MGYIGHSMSERAAEAYAEGAAPLSKWTRARLLDGICTYPGSEWTPRELKRATVADLRTFFLDRSSWHHTSKFYSRTDFYSIDDEVIAAHDVAALNDLAEASRAERASAACHESKVSKGRIVYDQWEGSRNYGRFRRHDEPCLIAGNWAYTEGGKKRLDGEHVVDYEVFERAPRGCAEVYKRIFKSLPASLKH